MSVVMHSTKEELHAAGATEPSFHPVIRFAAKVISFVFHPLFIPVYISWFLLDIIPIFKAFTPRDRALLLIRFGVMYTLFPLVTILLAKGLGFIQSIYLRTQRDRIIPYVACGLYYFWMWYTLHNQPEFPRELVLLALAIFIASSAGLIFNAYIKISMHTIAVGVMVSFVMLLALVSGANFGVYLSVAFLISGLVGSARLVNSDHHPIEVYAGFIAGIASLLLAYYIMY